MISGSTPPLDSLAAFYGWGKAIDGEVLVKFFNDMARYAEPGYQDRLNILGIKNGWVFNIVFSEKGVTTSLPTVSVSLGNSFPNSSVYEVTIPRPARGEGESYADLTTRWLQVAYTALLEFNGLADNPFNFSQGLEWFVDPDISPSDAVIVLQDDIGTPNEVWGLPASASWIGLVAETEFDISDATITEDGVAPTVSTAFPPATSIVVQFVSQDFSEFPWKFLWDYVDTPYPVDGEKFCVVMTDSGKIWLTGYDGPIINDFGFVGNQPILTSATIQRITTFEDTISDEAAMFRSLNPQ